MGPPRMGAKAPPTDPAPPPAAAPAMNERPRYLRRPEAAQWFQGQGIAHVTVKHLADLADQGRGPAYHRMGKYVYYAEAALQAWLDETLQPAERGRAKPRTKAA